MKKLVLLILQTCLLAVLCEEILPVEELHELDVFLQDDKYDEINRIKRRDNDTLDEESGSGEADYRIEPTLPTAYTSNTEKILSDSSPYEEESADITDFLTTNENELGDNRKPDSEATTPNNENITPSYSNQTEINTSDVEQANAGNFTHSRAIHPDVPVINDNNGTILLSTTNTAEIDEDISPVTIKSAKDELQNSSSTKPLSTSSASNISLTTKTSYLASSSAITSATSTPVLIGKQSTESSAGTTSSKPSVSESTKTPVSGSGVLFTIIILVVLAALGGVGYFMYKKRKNQYNPVAVEEEGKEMEDIRAENGYFGKPIFEEEVKLENEITPIQPKPAPRTFGTSSNDDDKSFEKVEIIKHVNEEKGDAESTAEFKEVKKDDRNYN